jgi:two-component system, OmpR family, alkaline phosphatase synthesis response regulator PhoP
MTAKINRSRQESASEHRVSPIAKGEIEVLRYLVKSALGKKKGDDEILKEASFGNINVSFIRHELFKNGKRVSAGTRELRLLKYFILHEGEVISRDKLLHDVWDFDKNPTTRSVDNYVLRLRKIIEDDPAVPKYILTMHRAGYKFIR